MTLNQLTIGQQARVIDLTGEDAITIRLMEMGLIEGTEVSFLGAAPLGDPLEFAVRGYRLSLRRSEAERIAVELLPTPV